MRCPPSAPRHPGVVGWGIFIFLIALGIIQMDIGGRTDCGCRLDDKFFFRSTPAPVLFRPFIPIGIGVKKTRASLIILDLSAADCNAFFFFPVLRRLKMVGRGFFTVRGKLKLIVAIRDRLNPKCFIEFRDVQRLLLIDGWIRQTKPLFFFIK